MEEYFYPVRRLFALLATVLTVLACSQQAFAQDRDQAACSAETAIATTIDAIKADRDLWRGKCVSVEGILWHQILLADRQAVADYVPPYASADHRSLGMNYRDAMGRFGEDNVPAIVSGNPRNVRAIGQIGYCSDAAGAIAELNRQNPDAIYMASGHCHYTGDDYLLPLAVEEVNQDRVLRLVADELPQGAGSLARVDRAAIPEAAEIGDQAQAALRALADRDIQDYLSRAIRIRSVDFSVVETLADLESGAFDLDTHELRGLVEGLPVQTGLGHIAARTDQPDLLLQNTASFTPDLRRMHLTACWCRGDDCAGKWPVAPGDIDNAAERPFFCLNAFRFVLRGETVIRITMPFSDDGFAEPEWPQG